MPEGTVLEINKVALDAVGIEISDVEGKPFWTTFWWQVSDEIRATLRELIARAAQGEFVRWDTPIYGRAGGKETIIIDASLCPVKDEDGNVVFICAEGRDITENSKLEAGKLKITLQDTDVAALVRFMASHFDVLRPSPREAGRPGFPGALVHEVRARGRRQWQRVTIASGGRTEDGWTDPAHDGPSRVARAGVHPRPLV